MNVVVTLLDILKYILPSLVVLIAATAIVRRFLNAENQKRQIAIFGEAQDVTLRLRLQAYERLVMFLERMSPRQLIPRVYDPSMTVRDLQTAMTQTIRSEFEHNLSQQIYVSRNAWETVKSVQEQELAMINKVSATLNPDAAAKELHIRILEILAHANTELPSEMALQILNAEVRTVLQYGSV